MLLTSQEYAKGAIRSEYKRIGNATVRQRKIHQQIQHRVNIRLPEKQSLHSNYKSRVRLKY
jgi:hypothetical protein